MFIEYKQKYAQHFVMNLHHKSLLIELKITFKIFVKVAPISGPK